MKLKRVWVFGEVLVDHFPDGSTVLGGAPFNVAWHLQAFGCPVLFVSRVGRDQEGDEILAAMSRWQMTLAGVEIDDDLPSGRVDVSLVNGDPRYDIAYPAAFDRIECGDAIQRSLDGHALLYHGTLALRDAVSRAALEKLRWRAGTVFVDVNLRPPWFDSTTVRACLAHADWLKLNGDEQLELSAIVDEPLTEEPARFGEHNLSGLLLTLGAHGARLGTSDGHSLSVQPKQRAAVVDSVGAGDAFSAVMILGIIERWPLDVTLERAQDFASRIVGQRGATVSDIGFYQRLLDDWV